MTHGPYDGPYRWFLRGHDPRLALVPTVFQCMIWIAALKIGLAIAGSGRTIRWIRHRSASPIAAARGIEALAAIEYTVAMAAAFYPGRAMCLERSLVLFRLARRAGIPVTYHHGVQPLPFKAHAWVEYQNRVINDVPEFVETFLPFPPIIR